MKAGTDDTTPCARAMSKVYSGPKFGDWASQKPGLYPHEARLLEAHRLPKDASFLVVGAGNGRETFGIYDAGFHNVRGVDITPGFVELANQRSRELQLGIDFVLASADKLPFPAQSFSVVTMFENLYAHLTPRSARLATLTEARRVMKPGRLIFLEATNLRERFRYLFYIRLMDVLHCFYNPCRLGRSDKLMHEATQLKVPAPERPRTHWFRPHEIDAEAREVSLEVVQATTIEAIQIDPSANATAYRHMGRLLYVLRKPFNSNDDSQ